jgi:hypothetical protein
MSYAASVNNNQIGLLWRLGPAESPLFEQFSNLLTFVLVDLAAKRIDGKSPHDVI